jgi:hypothetical protein
MQPGDPGHAVGQALLTQPPTDSSWHLHIVVVFSPVILTTGSSAAALLELPCPGSISSFRVGADGLAVVAEVGGDRADRPTPCS